MPKVQREVKKKTKKKKKIGVALYRVKAKYAEGPEGGEKKNSARKNVKKIRLSSRKSRGKN